MHYPSQQRDMERFYTAFNRFDAYLLLHRLQQAGIAAHVFNEHVQSIVGYVPPDVAQPQVWLERASRSISERNACSPTCSRNAGKAGPCTALLAARTIR